MSDLILFKKTRELEGKITTFLMNIIQSGFLFVRAFEKYFTDGIGSEFMDLRAKVSALEAENDSLRREVESQLYVQMLLPDMRSDILRMIEGCDKIINKYETDLIFKAISEKAPAITRDGNIINAGYDDKLDEYRSINENATKIINQLEEYEKKETGIKNLKIRSNKVFGYYIEVSNSQTDLVPYRYIRKQTIAGGERYITQELKELEEKIVNANFLSVARENELYADVLQKLSARLLDYISTAKAIAYLDCIVSHALTARENRYVKPIINSGSGGYRIHIEIF